MEFRDSFDPQCTRESSSESGFMLVFAVVMVALVLIALAAAAPVVAKQLRRDKELESEHRAQQYVRAIRLYYRKFKTYPPSMEALETSNNVRFLRKQYVDPLTGKNDWRIIHVGENKTTVKGFFGEPLGGLNTSGAGGGLGSASGMQSNLGATPGAASGASSSTSGTSSTTVSGGSPLSAGFSGATIGGGAAGSALGSASGLASSSSGSGGLGQIMGVGTAKTGDSILDPNGQTTYETWEFIYDPKIELMYQKANILGGAAGGTLNSQPASTFGSNAATGQSNSNNQSPTSSSPTTNTPPQKPPATNSPF